MAIPANQTTARRLAAPPLKGRCALIRHQHILQGTYAPWNGKRFNRLMLLLNCTMEELCEYAAVFDYGRMRHWLRLNAIPPYVALHLIALERAYGEAMFNRQAETPMPIAELVEPQP